MESATQAAVRSQGRSGVLTTTVGVAGQTVGVRGRVMEGVARIGSFWIPWELRPVMESLTKLEQAVLEKLLAGDHPTLAVLRVQVERTRVVERSILVTSSSSTTASRGSSRRRAHQPRRRDSSLGHSADPFQAAMELARAPGGSQ